MSELDLYLKKHYLNKAQFAAACQSSEAEIDTLMQAQMLPAPSYVVTENAKICSAVFGEMEATDTSSGDYFHPANTVWFDRAKQMIAAHGIDAAPAALKQEFIVNFSAALSALNISLWNIADSFEPDGTIKTTGLTERVEFSWKHFLLGTFGLCVANPVSEAAIANKEILQEKLSALSENGAKASFSQAEAAELLPLVDAFAAAAMWFSPAEYHLCSRKRLVDDFRPRLQAIMTSAAG
ncbi:DUF6058 family natural product biosynthesis protein [Undibacterium sp. TS12]|uniref:DUF6058 family natural product biosynthesis protein n=1 Tax=Undibacterium sp. TS12 TaxID=2908202 RepID=UPI001F4C8890|nr:DUF6058 family natural product biosynthesis protein [Undibacterium sp. TS12]MCH8618112.1 DUF6058 family natural product biosynthesis protein [Undibacterium sp. TS12]